MSAIHTSTCTQFKSESIKRARKQMNKTKTQNTQNQKSSNASNARIIDRHITTNAEPNHNA